MNESEFVELLRWALPQRGLRFEGLRNLRGTVRKRLSWRLGELGLSLSEYRERLKNDPAEWMVFERMCRITISRFHRDHAVFEALANEIPARGARVWSAGCASGEEPYTLAILFPNVLEIVATDVDAQLIERARRGCYPGGSLRELPEHLREQAFVREGELYCVRPEHRRAIQFRCEDLRETMPDGPFDAILCRNLAFTYFDEPVQREVATAMLARLRPDGVLVIGGRERLPAGLQLQESSRGCYRRVP